ncbi:hypothetical protein FGG08_003512 [Glutinoglossum americanum]|uniref:Uncharacterized protein n=1 Tax=Glutinoglossum americanum TaxID=1670608 RepID=A0A9P8L0J3_9PEZI|nr:hypothetical protein FGG08_003512 [Glutinoglossum americanum]
MRELGAFRRHASRISLEMPTLRNRHYSRSTMQRRHTRITTTRPVMIHNPTPRGTIIHRLRSRNMAQATKDREKRRQLSDDDKRLITALSATVMIALLFSFLCIRFLCFLFSVLPLRRMSGFLSIVCRVLERAIRGTLIMEAEDADNLALTDASTGTEDLKEWSRGSEAEADAQGLVQNVQQLPDPDQDHEDHDTDGENSSWTAKTGDLKNWLKSVGFTHNDASHVESYREAISEFIASVRNAGWLSPTAEGADGPANVTQVPTPRAPPSSPEHSIHSSGSSSVKHEQRAIPLVTARISSSELRDLDTFWPAPNSVCAPVSVRTPSRHESPSKGGNVTSMSKSFTPISKNRNHFRRQTCSPTPVGQLMDKAIKILGRPSTVDTLPLTGENQIIRSNDFSLASTTEIFRGDCFPHGGLEEGCIAPSPPRGLEPYFRILPDDYFSSFYGHGDRVSDTDGANDQDSCTIFEDPPGKPYPPASAPVTPKKCRISKLPIRRPKSSSPRFSKLTESRMLKYKGSLKKKPLATVSLNTTPKLGSPLRTMPTPSPRLDTPKASLSMRRIILSTATEELFAAESDNEEDALFTFSSGRNSVSVRDEELQEDFFSCK